MCASTTDVGWNSVVMVFAGWVWCTPLLTSPLYTGSDHMAVNQRVPVQRLDAIVFRNFYCSHITIKRRQQQRGTAAATGGGKGGDPWVTILRDRPLMEDPHYEDDAQYWHVVTADEFDREQFDPESTAPLR